MNKLFGILLIGILCFAGCSVFAAEIIQDELVKEFLLDKQIEKPEPFLNYNYENTDVVEIKLAIVDAIKSENDIYENQPVKFRVLSDVHYKGRVIIKRNTIVPAKVDVIIRSGMNGIPASIIFGNFEFEGINKHLISDTYEVRGQDRSLLVFPLKWALTFLPPTGSLTNFIKGGHARINPKKVVKIYYHPKWIMNNEQEEI